MNRATSRLLFATTLLIGSASAGKLVITPTTVADEVCDPSLMGGFQCALLRALIAPPAVADVTDTLVFGRNGDTVQNLIWFVQRDADVPKPVVLIDSSYLATGTVRTRLEGLRLRFARSPVHVEGFAFTRAGTNRSSVSLLGPGPDKLIGNQFNLAPGDSGTPGIYAMQGVSVGSKNVKSRIENNWFGVFGDAFASGTAITLAGDSTSVLNNRFGFTKAGAALAFNGVAVTLTGSTAAGSGGAADTSFAPVGGTIAGNRIATCAERSSGIIVGGSAGEGGTRGWSITGNLMGASVSDSTKVLAGCAPSLDETQAGIRLAGADSTLLATGNTIQNNRIWVAANGILLNGPGVTGNTIRNNRIGSPDQTLSAAVIPYNGLLVIYGAKANTLDSNTLGGAGTGIRLGWGTGYGNAVNNQFRANLIGAVATATSLANDTGISLGYTSAGNLFENNIIAGNRHHGMTLASQFLAPNRIERNRFGVTANGALRANGGSSIRTTVGAGRQVIRGNWFGPSTGWGVEIASAVTRATTLDSNRFLGGQDSGAILFQQTDSLFVLHNTFEACTRGCVQLRGSKIGRFAHNRFGGNSPALIARNHPTQPWQLTNALLDTNVLPAIATPIVIADTTGSFPNDRGAMRNLIGPRLQSVAAAGDSLVLTYNLDTTTGTSAPRLHVYAKLPDSTVLLPLGSWPATYGTARRLAFVPRFATPTGTLFRVGLTDGGGNTSRIDSGRTIGGTTIAPDPARANTSAKARWEAGGMTVRLGEPAQVRWEIAGLDGRARHQGVAALQTGTHRINLPGRPETTILRVFIDDRAALTRLLPADVR